MQMAPVTAASEAEHASGPLLCTYAANFAVSGMVCSLYNGQQDFESTMQIKDCRHSGKKEACNHMRMHKAK